MQLRVAAIQHVDFGALKRAGCKGVVFDKDNCLVNRFSYQHFVAYKFLMSVRF